MAKATPIFPQHQEFLDEHFSIEPKWQSFQKKLKDKRFAEAVRQDTRSDPKLVRFSKMIGLRQQSKSKGVLVPGDTGSKHRIKYHPENSRFSCSCGDFTYVRSVKRKGSSGECKHIKRMKQGAKEMMKEKSAAAPMNVFRLAKAMRGEELARDEVTKSKIKDRAYRAHFPRQGLISQFMKSASVRGRAASVLLAK